MFEFHRAFFVFIVTQKAILSLQMWIESLDWCLNFIGFFLFIVPQNCYLDLTMPNESLGWCFNFVGLLFLHSSSKGYRSWAYNVNKSLGWELWLTFEFHCLFVHSTISKCYLDTLASCKILCHQLSEVVGSPQEQLVSNIQILAQWN